MNRSVNELLQASKVIPSIKDQKGLERVLQSDCLMVFVLYGDLMSIEGIVTALKKAGKMVFINVDLITGLSNKEIIVPYIKERTCADGILSAKASIIKEARNHNLIAIHRFFLIDSLSYANMYKQIKLSNPDAIQVLPGWDAVISWIKRKISVPIIAGGLVCKKELAEAAISAGAAAVSTTNFNVWKK